MIIFLTSQLILLLFQIPLDKCLTIHTLSTTHLILIDSLNQQIDDTDILVVCNFSLPAFRSGSGTISTSSTVWSIIPLFVITIRHRRVTIVVSAVATGSICTEDFLL